MTSVGNTLKDAYTTMKPKGTAMRTNDIKIKVTLTILALLVGLAIGSCGDSKTSLSFPETPVRTVVDTLHGVEIADDYRWLEDGKSPEVKKWADEQDKYCRQLLGEYAGRKDLEASIEKLMKIGSMNSPAVYGGKYFYMKRIGDENHAILYMRRSPEGPTETVLDPNAFSTDGTVALDWWYPSTDGGLMAYGKSAGGTENSTLFLMNIDSRKMLKDTIPFTDAASIAWLKDNSGFYYTRYPAPGTVPEGDEVYYRRVYFHKIGSDYYSDPLIFGEGRDKTEWLTVQISPDDKHLIIGAYMGWSKCDLFLKNLAGGGDFMQITDGEEAIHTVFPLNDAMYIFTNYQAPRYRIMKADYNRPKLKEWKVLVPEKESIMESFTIAAGNIVVIGLQNAASKASIYGLDGTFKNDIALPAIGSIDTYYEHSLGAEPGGKDLLFAYNSYFIPPSIYRYQFDTGELTVFDEIKTDLDLTQFEVEQVWYPSKDGTKVSMFLTHRKDIKLDGGNPTLVYGYGGFNSNEKPYFSRTMTLFLSKGGVYAHTQLRGGGEYGEEWHRAGMLENKQNSFDDMIAACEWLIANKYTSSQKLIIEGGSNGGLLVGAVLVQRPDLMKAVVCSRPLLDMLRYQKFLIGSLWVPEYGSADDSTQFEYLYEYSPYHHIKKDVSYPAVLLQSADNDTRVDPLHAYKMAAALQAATASNEPILLRIQRQTGHGQGAPQRIIIEELVDEWSFVYWQLGL
ncbi:MAG: S9 family peptidase [candidate division Zixibacteria bacterium HGW-Zixibacteria-1]|nr:MAG: S9 family peptidase [candidate division Zixibacteria bacterium HGW-Zixibacteria-1]